MDEDYLGCLVIIIAIFCLVIGIFAGFQYTKNEVYDLKKSLTDSGYAEYKIVDKSTGITEFKLNSIEEIVNAYNIYKNKQAEKIK